MKIVEDYNLKFTGKVMANCCLSKIVWNIVFHQYITSLLHLILNNFTVMVQHLSFESNLEYGNFALWFEISHHIAWTVLSWILIMWGPIMNLHRLMTILHPCSIDFIYETRILFPRTCCITISNPTIRLTYIIKLRGLSKIYNRIDKGEMNFCALSGHLDFVMDKGGR